MSDLPDPLIAFPEATFELPVGLSQDERLRAAFIAVSDHVNLHAMAWPARAADGNLVPPPDDHVLHELAHAYDLVEEERLLVKPRIGDVGVVWELPECDLCGANARYDAVVGTGGQRGGANLCPPHYLEHGSGTLGASGDAYLMLTREVSEWVKEACNQLAAAQGRDPLF